jgi:alkylated DNA repair dioxygenase AlkB
MTRNATACPPLRLPDADIELHETFLEISEARRLFDTLKTTVAWSQHRVRVFGREYPCPRLSAWYGDASAIYRYSGQTLEPIAWTPELLLLRDRVAEHCRCELNSVLLNLYRDGSDGMGWHSDDEPELGPDPLIASLSIGETRKFRMRHRNRRDLSAQAWWLPPGSLFVMRGKTQRYWQHELPKTKRRVRPRINLTFRMVREA